MNVIEVRGLKKSFGVLCYFSFGAKVNRATGVAVVIRDGRISVAAR